MNTFLVLGSLGCLSSVYLSDVIELNSNNFKRQVIWSDDLWIIEFYALRCRHCKVIFPEYENVARILKGIVKVGAVDAGQHRSLGLRYGLKRFPSLKIFGTIKYLPKHYNGKQNAVAIVEAMLIELDSFVRARLNRLGRNSGGK